MSSTPLTRAASRDVVAQRRAQRRRLTAATALAYGSLGVTLALNFDSGEPRQALEGLVDQAPAAAVGTVLTELGVVAGLVGGHLVLLMLLLAARLPVLDRTLGQDGAWRLHARLGRVGVPAVLAHAVLLTAGLGLARGIGPVGAVAEMLSADDLPLAALALALFGVVGVTSARAVRRRWPHEVWQAVHLLSYAAVALGVPHQFSQSRLFVAGSPAAWWWLALYATAAAALLAYRVVVPAWTALTAGLRVADVRPVGGDAVEVTVTGPGVVGLDARAGQFLRWRFLDAGRPGSWPRLALASHPYSLSAAPTGDVLRLTVRGLGASSRAVAGLRPGTRVFVSGPHGRFTHAARTRRGLMLAGAGVGVGPIAALLEAEALPAADVTVLLRGRTRADIPLVDRVEALGRARGHRVVVSTGPRSAIHPWLGADGDDAAHLLPAVTDTDVFACGPDGWTGGLRHDLLAAGLPAEAFHAETFDPAA